MRKLMWFTIGFGLSCICSVLLVRPFLPLWGCIGLSLLFLCFSLVFKRWGINSRLITFAIGACIGLSWFCIFHAAYVQPLTQYDGETIPLDVKVSSFPENTQHGISVDGTVSIDDHAYRVKVFLQPDIYIVPGMKLSGDFKLRLTTPDGRKDSSYYQGNGLYVTLSPKGKLQVGPEPDRVSLVYIPTYIAHFLKENIDRCFPEDTAAFAKALLLGDTSELSYSDDTALKVSGIRHIVAVSGLHVSILFGLFLLIFDFHRIWTPLISIPALLFFAALTGFTPSVTRACLMTILMILGLSIFEEYDGLTSLSFASLLMMLGNPYIIFSVSFQLSVSSVAGILVFSSPMNRRIDAFLKKILPVMPKKIRFWLSSSLSVTFSSLITTIPFTAVYFGTISLLSPITNLLTLGFVSIIFVGTLFSSLICGFVPQIGALAAWCVSWFIRYILIASHWIAELPFAAVYTQSVYIVAWIVICYLLFFLFFLYKRKGFFLYLAAAFVSLIIAISMSICIPALDCFRMTVMDVGEGQCILIQNDGLYFMVDCGGDSDTGAANIAAQTLLSQGIRHLDGVVITHFDRDHYGALKNLLTRIPADKVFYPDDGTDICDVASHNIEAYPVNKDMQIQMGNGIVSLLVSDNAKTNNENSLCLLFESPDCDILITGDRSASGEKELIQKYDLPDVDVLVAGHHGSKTSTSDSLLNAVTPEVVVISVGRNNTYGHPSSEVLERISRHNCEVYRTDLDGTIVVKR